MKKTKEELLGLGLLENTTVEEAIEYYGPETILDKIDDNDIFDRIDTWMLSRFDDSTLLEAMNDTTIALDCLSVDEIVDYLEEEREYKVEETDILLQLKKICRELNPHGYIDKEEAKRLLCDYIDTWMTRSFDRKSI